MGCASACSIWAATLRAQPVGWVVTQTKPRTLGRMIMNEG